MTSAIVAFFKNWNLPRCEHRRWAGFKTWHIGFGRIYWSWGTRDVVSFGIVNTMSGWSIEWSLDGFGFRFYYERKKFR